MRRVVWSVLTGLGVFFIVLAIMSRFVVPAQAVKFPLNEYKVSNLVATNASWFSPKSGNELSGVTIRITNTVKGDVSGAETLGSANTAAWESFAAIEDTTNNQEINIPAYADELAFNRKTGVLVPWSGNEVDGKHVSVSGQGFVWPLGAKKQSYQVFDTTLLKPVTFNYKGTATTDGVPTYVYSANIPATQTGTQAVPGSLVGLSAAEVTLPEFYSSQETYYVDPVTGAPLLVKRDVQQVLKDSSGTTRLVLLDANFQTSAASVTSSVNSDNHYRTEINIAKDIVPIIALIVGIIALAAGLVLSRLRPEDEEYEDDYEPVRSSV
jgi:Porin PorA